MLYGNATELFLGSLDAIVSNPFLKAEILFSLESIGGLGPPG